MHTFFWRFLFTFTSDYFPSFDIFQKSFRKKLQQLDSQYSIRYDDIGAKLSNYDKDDYEDILMMSVSTSAAGMREGKREGGERNEGMEMLIMKVFFLIWLTNIWLSLVDLLTCSSSHLLLRGYNHQAAKI